MSDSAGSSDSQSSDSQSSDSQSSDSQSSDSQSSDSQSSDSDRDDAGGVAAFFHELGQLKRVRRSGWWVAGIDDAESVAEHVWRTAAIAFVLAKLEGADPHRAAAIAVFHDIAETRINDQHHLGRSYVDASDAEERVIQAQSARLPAAIAASIGALTSEARAKETPEARIAKDADRLECLFQAREYEAAGHRATKTWIETARAALVTESARRIADACVRGDPHRWWSER